MAGRWWIIRLFYWDFVLYQKQMKSIYMKNFQLYVENYLPNSSPNLIPLIKNVKMDYRGLDNSHYSNYHSYAKAGITQNTDLQQRTNSYKTGN
jgi:hypothetical protein